MKEHIHGCDIRSGVKLKLKRNFTTWNVNLSSMCWVYEVCICKRLKNGLGMMFARLKMFIGGWEMWEVEVAMNGMMLVEAYMWRVSASYIGPILMS